MFFSLLEQRGCTLGLCRFMQHQPRLNDFSIFWLKINYRLGAGSHNNNGKERQVSNTADDDGQTSLQVGQQHLLSPHHQKLALRFYLKPSYGKNYNIDMVLY